MVTCKDCFHCEACKPLVEQCNKLVGEDGYCSYLIAQQVGVKFVKIMQVKG